jgi:hypothetical protein
VPQRNAKHEARLSKHLGFNFRWDRPRDNQRFFSRACVIRMTL